MKIRLAAGFLIVTGILAAAVLAIAHAASTPRAAVCQLASIAFVPQRDLPRMVKFQDMTMTSSPFAGFIAASKPPPVVSEFEGARLVGYIARGALQGRYKQNSAQVRRQEALPPGKGPVVPLTGAIVSHSPHTILEWYEATTVYRSAGGARMHLGMLERSHDDTKSTHSFVLRLGTQSYAYEASPRRIARQPQGEWGYGMDVREGTVVLQLGVWGGRGIPRSTAVRLATQALESLHISCGE